MRLRTFALLLPLAFTCYAQLDETIPSQHLKEDFEIFRGTLEDFHAGLYWYTSREDLDQAFDEVYGSLNTEITTRDFYKKLASITSQVRCGHTFIVPSEAQLEHIWQGKLLPLDISIIDKKFYCRRHLAKQEGKIETGVEILSLNGWSTDSLLTNMLQYHSLLGDGDAISGKIQEIQNHFSTIYAILFGQPDSYQITYVKNGNTQTVEINALTVDEIREVLARSPGSKNQRTKNLQLTFADSLSAAVLKIRSFSNRKNQKFRKRLRRMMTKIAEQKVDNVILDLRNNAGGDDEFGLELFSYFYDKPIVEFEKQEFIIDKSEYFKYSDMSAFKLGMLKALQKIRKVNDSTYRLYSQKTLKPFPPSFPQYKGQLYVLVNGGTFSTGADVAALLKSYKRGILIGEETGGGYYGNTSGLGVTTMLPHSGLRMVTPIIKYTTAVEKLQETGRGVIPDFRVLPKIQDQVQGVDTELEFTMKLVSDQEISK